jgi:hypothetical protein
MSQTLFVETHIREFRCTPRKDFGVPKAYFPRNDGVSLL